MVGLLNSKNGKELYKNMKIALNTYEAANMLLNDENGGWSYAGSLAMIEFLEDIELGLGEEMELDMVAIRCDYSEYESLQSWLCDYYGAGLHDALKQAGIDLEDDELEDDDVIDEWIRSHIYDHGTVIEFDGGIIVSSF